MREALPALRRERGDDASYLHQIEELSGFLVGEFLPGHRFAQVKLPRTDTLPLLFMLGSSEASALHAASLGWSLAFAHHQNPELTPSAISAYRSAFDVSKHAEQRVDIAGIERHGAFKKATHDDALISAKPMLEIAF